MPLVDNVYTPLIALLLVFALVVLLPGDAAASPCTEATQGVIAWDGRADTRWEENDLEQLCQSAEDSLEPTRCFRALMSGRINWGGGSQWNPRNALNLCRASRDARTTLRCFREGISAGNHWREAIAGCQVKLAATPVGTAQMPTDPGGLPAGHSFGNRDGEFKLGDDKVYRIGCNNCQVLYCAPGDEILSHGGACEFGGLARNYVEQRFNGACAGSGCWTATLSCRDSRSRPLSVIESRPSIQARCLERR